MIRNNPLQTATLLRCGHENHLIAPHPALADNNPETRLNTLVLQREQLFRPATVNCRPPFGDAKTLASNLVFLNAGCASARTSSRQYRLSRRSTADLSGQLPGLKPPGCSFQFASAAFSVSPKNEGHTTSTRSQIVPDQVLHPDYHTRAPVLWDPVKNWIPP